MALTEFVIGPWRGREGWSGLWTLDSLGARGPRVGPWRGGAAAGEGTGNEAQEKL